jgi:hypothetical protein
MAKNYIANKLTPRKEPIIRRLVKRAIKSKNKAIKTVAVKRFKDYEQMEIDSKAALIQELIPIGTNAYTGVIAGRSITTCWRQIQEKRPAGIQAMGKSEGVSVYTGSEDSDNGTTG